MSYYDESSTSNIGATTTTILKQSFNKYRRKPDDPSFIDDLNELVDFSINPQSDPRIIDLTKRRKRRKNSDRYEYQGPIFGLKSHPGFAYIPSALSPTLQRDFVYSALTEFCQPPHGTNIDLVPRKEGIEHQNKTKNEAMWELWKKDNMEEKEDCDEKKRYYKNFSKLSWATLGYRFDWTARAYREKNKSIMPPMLQSLGEFFARLGEEINPNGNADEYSFTASAAIVNYYSLKSSMGGHRDDSELDVSKPVVSFSLGLPAVFLIGAATKEEGPVVPLLLRPGDVMLLGGDVRLNFHGVARILSGDVELPPVQSDINGLKVKDYQIDSWNKIFGNEVDVNIDTPPSDFEAIEKFLTLYRVNANVRQVLPDGVDRIPGDDSDNQCNSL